MTEESKNVQTTPTHTYCKHYRPLTYYHPKCRTPRHWKFTQDNRTTRPPPDHPRISARSEFREVNKKRKEKTVKYSSLSQILCPKPFSEPEFFVYPELRHQDRRMQKKSGVFGVVGEGTYIYKPNEVYGMTKTDFKTVVPSLEANTKLPSGSQR